MDLRELYQEVILDHNKSPRNFGPLASATNKADGSNPLCGDKCTVFVELRDATVQKVNFAGSGCAISTASASLMTEALTGKSIDEARALFERMHDLLTSDESTQDIEGLGKLAVFSGVREYPMRVKCATLAWHTLKSALEGNHEPVSTE